MSLVVDSEVGQLGLSGNSELLADVCHLERFLTQVPLVPVVVGLDVLLDEVDGALQFFVDHQGRTDREQGVHTVATLQQRGQGSVGEVILHLQ